MHLLSVFLLALCTNIDNLMISVNIGLSRKKISIQANLFIAFMSALFTYIFSQLASFCSQIGKMANIIGSILIIVLGITALLQDSTDSKERNNEHYENYTIKKVLVLALALSVNCMPVAFGAGLTGMSPLFCTLAVGIFSAACMRIGNILGLKTSDFIKGNLLKYISGVSMIILGIIELFI